jgi:uncharacterized protein
MTAAQIVLLFASGLGAGLLGSMLGLGGGILIVPILVLLLDLPMHNAVATSLICVIATSSGAAATNLLRGTANLRLAMTLEPMTVAGGLAGALLAGLLSGTALMIIFAAAMALMSIPMLRAERIAAVSAEIEHEEPAPQTRGAFDGSYHDASSGLDVSYAVERLQVAVGVSSLAGIVSGLLGVGGGLVKVPVLTLLCRVPMKAAAATSNLMMGVTALASAIIYYARGEVFILITGATAAGVFAGARAGAHLVQHVPANLLRRLFALVMWIVALQLTLKATGVAF